MNGAELQFFLHEKMPHVWLLYDLPESKSYTETWKEIALFIQNVVDKDTIVSKAQRVHWDGSRDDIDEAEYISMSQAEVPLHDP